MADDRTAPHSLEAERSVLGAILIDNETMKVAAATIDAKAFFRDAHRRIFDRMLDLSERSQPIDLVTLTEELERAGELEEVGGPAYVASLVDGVPRSTNVEYYAQIVKDEAARRRLIEIARSLDHGARHDEDLPQLVERFEVATRDAVAGRGSKRRSLSLVSAGDIRPRPVKWLWSDRLALGSFGLLAGREGIGKSAVAYDIAASMTTGRLPGCHHGDPRDVIIVATEDSREHTIVPRLIGARADLDRVHFVNAIDGGADSDLILPVDIPELTRLINDVAAIMVILDPLLSRLAVSLDSHKDAEARRALEPLARAADVTGAVLLGLIHLNKSTSQDPLTMLMASRAFAAVARTVLFAAVDPDDDQRRLLGLVKSNLGRTDVPVLGYRIVPKLVAESPEGPVYTGAVEWLGEASSSVRDAISNTNGSTAEKSATTDAAEWLADYLAAAGGGAARADIHRDGKSAGHGADHLRRARERLRLRAVSLGFPRTTRWELPQSCQSGHLLPTPTATATTATTGAGDISERERETVVAVMAVDGDEGHSTTTGPRLAWGRS